MNIEIAGKLCVASGGNWEYKRVGDTCIFTQSGKTPSLRIVKTIIKLHLKMHDIGATLVCNELPSRCSTPNYDRRSGGMIKSCTPYKVGGAGI